MTLAGGRAGGPRARSRRPREGACPLSVPGGGRAHGTALQRREAGEVRLGRSQGTLRWSTGVVSGEEDILEGHCAARGRTKGPGAGTAGQNLPGLRLLPREAVAGIARSNFGPRGPPPA